MTTTTIATDTAAVAPIPVVLHAHFYQPPRENPWTDRVDREPSASPFHDWNERITSECYAAIAHARIFGGSDRIAGILNTYSALSFNVGPTLFAWLATHDPDTYRRIIEADKTSASRHGGHGGAIAQGYNHAILPLCNDRDRKTQIRWGIADFRHRFGREPEAMWLPETGCNVATAQALAEHGMRFIILAPRQAARARLGPSGAWKNVSNGSIDPRHPYRLRLPGGHSIVCFFYDGAAAHAFSFEATLDSSQSLANRLVSAAGSPFSPGQLVSVATDGETYGHHKRFAERALGYFIEKEAPNHGLELTNYGAFLEGATVAHEVELAAGPNGEGTAWSCAHGLGRWTRDCSCCMGHRPGWTQAWRAPLRAAFDRLRDHAASVFEDVGGELLKDPWSARDASIALILEPRTEVRDVFFAEHARRELSGRERVQALQLLEAQRMTQLMYTSCGWFFDDLSGLETVQVTKYAVMGAQLLERASGRPALPALIEALAEARSNLAEQGSGADIVRKHVLPQEVTPRTWLVRRASRLLFSDAPPSNHRSAFTIESLDSEVLERGSHRLVLGRARVVLTRTEEPMELTYAATTIADREMHCGVVPFEGRGLYERVLAEAKTCFRRPSLAEVIRLVDRHFGPECFSLRDLDAAARSEFIERMITGLIDRLGATYAFLYDEHRKTIEAIEATGVEVPRELRVIAEYTLARRFDAAMLDTSESVDPGPLRAAIAIGREAKELGIELRLPRSEATLRRLLVETARVLVQTPTAEVAGRMIDLLTACRAPGLNVTLDRVQDVMFESIHGGALDSLPKDALRDLADGLMIELPPTVRE